MSDRQKSRKRKKGYYIKASQGKRVCHGHHLEPGMKGFLITCNNREKEAVREAYNILNEYADVIYGSDKVKSANNDANSTDSDESEDIETALKKEISSMKEKKSHQHRFQVVDSGAKNCVFIKTTLDDPMLVIHKYLSDVHQTKKAKSRFIMRFYPVIATCRTDGNKISQLIEDLLTPYMAAGEAKTYCILIKIRNNNDFGRNQIFPVMRRMIQDMNPSNDFDDKNPDYVFSMDVIKNVCCLSVMTDYYKFKKYNIQEIVKVTDVKDDPEPAGNPTSESVTRASYSISSGNPENNTGSTLTENKQKVISETSSQDPGTVDHESKVNSLDPVNSLCCEDSEDIDNSKAAVVSGNSVSLPATCTDRSSSLTHSDDPEISDKKEDKNPE